MQIHVQNAPFVYNPDTISVGLGFSKERGAKKLTGGMQYIKNISELCSVCLSLAAFTCYTTSKTWRLGGGHLRQTYFDQLLFVTVRLVCVINNVCAAEPEWCPAFTDYFTDCIARVYPTSTPAPPIHCLV